MGISTEHFKQVAMTIIIAVLSALFVGLLVDAVYESPKYENYCVEPFYPATPKVSEGTICDYTQSIEEKDCYKRGGSPRFDYDSKGCQIFNECDYCGKEFEEANKEYNRNVFFIVAPVGLVMIILGVFYSVGFIGSGFMFGGILSVAYGTIRYFSDMSKIMRVIVIFIELVIVVWLGLKKLRK